MVKQIWYWYYERAGQFVLYCASGLLLIFMLVFMNIRMASNLIIPMFGITSVALVGYLWKALHPVTETIVLEKVGDGQQISFEHLKEQYGVKHLCRWDNKERCLAVKDGDVYKAYEPTDYRQNEMKVTVELGDIDKIPEEIVTGTKIWKRSPGELYEALDWLRDALQVWEREKTLMEKLSPFMIIGSLAVGVLALVMLSDMALKAGR